ncbi:MAG TPA: DUF3426 domain-containing protein [Smithellaceae bacterium]|nr:DUF3426 domain-containing protein [Smithellaceae bacterium]
MIVQCKQCRTKFRFDDAQMEGDGLWMRCSRCQHVFFQDNPLNIKASAVTPQAAPAFSKEIPSEKTTGRLSFEPAAAVRGEITPDEDLTHSPDAVTTPPQTVEDESQPEFTPEKMTGMPPTDMELRPESEKHDDTDEFLETSDETPAPPARKKRSRLWMFALWTMLVIIVIPAIVYFVVFPQWGERLVQIARNYIGVSQQAEGQSVKGHVKIQDIRQRVINNYILGNIRIIEGTAVNQADFAVARVMVKAQILDAYAVVLGERESFAGNVLTDEELTNMSEEEILQKLSLAEGRDNSNQRVIPNGSIPFMIVFTRDPPGGIKTTVIISGAERLL